MYTRTRIFRYARARAHTIEGAGKISRALFFHSFCTANLAYLSSVKSRPSQIMKNSRIRKRIAFFQIWCSAVLTSSTDSAIVAYQNERTNVYSFSRTLAHFVKPYNTFNTMIAKQNGKRVTKFDIAWMIENLPGNTPRGIDSLCTIYMDAFTVKELAERYNKIIAERNLPHANIEIH